MVSIEEICKLILHKQKKTTQNWLKLKENKFLTGLKQRFAIQGGNSHFDLPQLQFWLHQPIQQIEHEILPLMESVVFIPNEKHSYEITTWIRSKKTTESNQNRQQGTEQNKIFTSPFNILLKESLAPFCEEGSLDNLEQLFTTNRKITAPVVLKIAPGLV